MTLPIYIIPGIIIEKKFLFLILLLYFYIITLMVGTVPMIIINLTFL